MTAATLTVVRPGLLTTVQDLGRWGHQALGVPVAGPMDVVSHRLANAMLGNPADAATLEVTMLGPELRAGAPLVAAMAGADFDLFVDDAPVPNRRALRLASGSRLRFGARHAGARAYLAVAGGICTTPVLGSRATHLVAKMGGHEGRALVSGDVLPVMAGESSPAGRRAAEPVFPLPLGRVTLRVMFGPQDHWFTAATLDTLVHESFRVSPRSNRMGFRLEGESLRLRQAAELLSEPVAFGAIQIPPGGEPILLMADRQTAGGYPKIATVIAADLPLAGQLAPGDLVSFASCTRAEALAALIARERDLLRVAPEALAMNDFLRALSDALPGATIQPQAPLAALTTFKVGGAAEWLVTPADGDAIIRAVQVAHRHGVPVTMLGGGSNVLVSDRGVPGLVIRTRGGDVSMVGRDLVRADAAVTINGLVRWTLNRGLQGLEAWAGTPGTVGGALCGNAHWQGANIGDLVESVRVVGRDGSLRQLTGDRLEFGYDSSRLQRSGEVAIWAAFRVLPGHRPDDLRVVARASLAFRKRTQPLESPSAGCIFQNPQPGRDRVPDGIPPSAGALVDRAGLKGASCGGARVSPTHANFIVNDGTATAADIAALVERCRDSVLDRFGVVLREEIVRLGAW